MPSLLSKNPAPLFVAGPRHDRMVLNDILIYWLSERPPSTRFYDFHPGVTTTVPVQREIVRSLAHVETVAVIPDRVEPNASALSSGVMLLDDYLAQHFRPAARVGRYRVLRRP